MLFVLGFGWLWNIAPNGFLFLFFLYLFEIYIFLKIREMVYFEDMNS